MFALLWREIGNSICLRPSFKSTSVTNLIGSKKTGFSFTRAQYVLSYHLIYSIIYPVILRWLLIPVRHARPVQAVRAAAGLVREVDDHEQP